MTKKQWLLGAVALAIVLAGWHFWAGRNAQAQQQAAASEAASASARLRASAAGSAAAQAASAGSGAAGASAMAAPVDASNTVVRPQLPRVESYRLTRTLWAPQQEQNIRFEGRDERVLGTRAIVDEQGAQTILITRDEASGALSYWQSGIRFALKEGQDYEAFLRENPRFTRRFVNADYADVSMDAGDVAAAYRSLSADPRVAGVRLLALPRRDKAK